MTTKIEHDDKLAWLLEKLIKEGFDFIECFIKEGVQCPKSIIFGRFVLTTLVATTNAHDI